MDPKLTEREMRIDFDPHRGEKGTFFLMAGNFCLDAVPFEEFEELYSWHAAMRAASGETK